MKEELKIQVENRIKLLGIKKSHVANQIGITNVYLSYCLNGKKTMSEEKVNKLKAYLSL